MIFLLNGERPFPHIENAQDNFNELPDRHQRGAVFWGFVSGLLNLPPGNPAPDSLNRQLDAVARRDARIVELNRPPTPLQALATEALDHVVEAVGKVVRVTKIDRAKIWLADVLQHGPVEASEIESRGRTAGFNLKLLKEAKKRLRVASVRKGKHSWRWRLPMANEPKDDGA